MSLDTYRVACSRGHDRIELTGQAAVDHAQECMGRKVGIVPGVRANGARGHIAWTNPTMRVRPYRWVAPKSRPLAAATTAHPDLVGFEAPDAIIGHADELGVGDKFLLSGRTYTVTARDGDRVTLRMRKLRNLPAGGGTLTIADLVERVAKMDDPRMIRVA